MKKLENWAGDTSEMADWGGKIGLMRWEIKRWRIGIARKVVVYDPSLRIGSSYQEQ